MGRILGPLTRDQESRRGLEQSGKPRAQEQATLLAAQLIGELSNDKNNLFGVPWQQVIKSIDVVCRHSPCFAILSDTVIFLEANEDLVSRVPIPGTNALDRLFHRSSVGDIQHYRLPLTSHNPVRWDGSIPRFLKLEVNTEVLGLWAYSSLRDRQVMREFPLFPISHPPWTRQHHITGFQGQCFELPHV